MIYYDCVTLQEWGGGPVPGQTNALTLHSGLGLGNIQELLQELITNIC